MLRAIFRRDVKLAFKQSSLAALGFFLIVLLTFMLSSQGDISAFALSVIWSALLLAHLLCLPFFLEDDLACGLLDLFLIEAKLPALFVIVKCLAFWVGVVLPLLLSMTLATFAFGFFNTPVLSLVLAVLVGSFGLVFLNFLVAALACGLRALAWLAPIIVLPLELPILIFGASASRLALADFWTSQAFMLLLGIVLFILASVPAVAAFALKIRGQ